MQQIDDAISGDSGGKPEANQATVKILASDARSVQAMPRLLVIVTVLLLCLRLVAYVIQSQSPHSHAPASPSGKDGAEL
jgi:hypothetical protein